MGNKSKQRTGVRSGLSWKKCRELDPLKFIHAGPFRLAPRSVRDNLKVVDPKTKRQYTYNAR